MTRALAATLLLAVAAPVSAKLLCPPGRFTLHATQGRAAVLDGRELVLGAGDAAITGICRQVRSPDFHRPSGRWLLRVRARWERCAGRSLALRAHFDLQDGSYCTRLDGRVRFGDARPVAVVAERTPECGNGLREAGEQCDDNGADTPCCGRDCRVKPGCPVACDVRHFPCAADEMCVYACGAGGHCEPRSQVHCGVWPVCDCNERVVYPDRCAAYEAGTGAAYAAPCRRYCVPGDPDGCAPTEFCNAAAENDCVRWQGGRPGTGASCTAVPFTCDGSADAPVCGCDGITYRNECELRRARMARFHAGACSSVRLTRRAAGRAPSRSRR